MAKPPSARVRPSQRKRSNTFPRRPECRWPTQPLHRHSPKYPASPRSYGNPDAKKPRLTPGLLHLVHRFFPHGIPPDFLERPPIRWRLCREKELSVLRPSPFVMATWSKRDLPPTFGELSDHLAQVLVSGPEVTMRYHRHPHSPCRTLHICQTKEPCARQR